MAREALLGCVACAPCCALCDVCPLCVVACAVCVDVAGGAVDVLVLGGFVLGSGFVLVLLAVLVVLVVEGATVLEDALWRALTDAEAGARTAISPVDSSTSRNRRIRFNPLPRTFGNGIPQSFSGWYH